MVAAGAVPVPAGVISFFYVAASVTEFPMGAELTAAAVFNIVHNLVLSRMQTVGFPKVIPVLAKNVSNRGTGFRLIRKLCMAEVCFHRLSKPWAEEIRGAQGAMIYDRRGICAFCK